MVEPMNVKTNKTNIVALIQARMGSTRLPGKVMKPITGRPMLDIQLERLKTSRLIHSIVVATTDQPQDEIIVDYCRDHQIRCTQGDEANVLKRFYEAAQIAKADIVIRLTADCPIIDPAIVDETIKYYLDHSSEYDYVSNVHPRTYPRGMDVEVFSFSALEKAYKEAKSVHELEHVTPYIIKHSNCGNVAQVKEQSSYRLTVDTPEDFEVVQRIFIGLYPYNPTFGLKDIMTYMDEHPDIAKINADIEQKPIEQE